MVAVNPPSTSLTVTDWRTRFHECFPAVLGE